MAPFNLASLGVAVLLALSAATPAQARKPAQPRPALHPVAYKAHVQAGKSVAYKAHVQAGKSVAPVVRAAPLRLEQAGDGDRFRYDSCGCSGS